MAIVPLISFEMKKEPIEESPSRRLGALRLSSCLERLVGEGEMSKRRWVEVGHVTFFRITLPFGVTEKESGKERREQAKERFTGVRGMSYLLI